MNKIFVVGSINVDYCVEVENFLKAGETVLSKNFKINYGGKGANQAYNASMLGSDVTFVSRVGNDSLGKEILNYFQKNNLNTSCIAISDKNTGSAFITLNKDFENQIIIVPGANEDVSEKDIENSLEFLKKSDIVILQNEININTIKYVIEKAYEMKKYIAYNLAPARNIEEKYFKMIDCLIVNETELEFLAINIFNEKNINDYDYIAKKLIEIGVKSVILTLGANGSKYIDKKNNIYVESKKVNVVDTTGAGDTFVGAFYTKFDLNKLNYKDALEYATEAASIAVSYKGAQVKEVGALKC